MLYPTPHPNTRAPPPRPQIILSVAEHHANLVPWQLLAARTGAVLRHVRLTPDRTQLDMEHFRSLLGPRTRLVSLVHVSNVLGAVLDTDLVAEETHKWVVGNVGLGPTAAKADSCKHVGRAGVLVG